MLSTFLFRSDSLFAWYGSSRGYGSRARSQQFNIIYLAIDHHLSQLIPISLSLSLANRRKHVPYFWKRAFLFPLLYQVLPGTECRTNTTKQPQVVPVSLFNIFHLKVGTWQQTNESALDFLVEFSPYHFTFCAAAYTVSTFSFSSFAHFKKG